MPDPVVPPVADPNAAPAWHTGADADLLGHIQNRGWADKPAAEVALAAARDHREAEKLIGAPAANVVKLPTDPNDAAGWKAVWARLGAPADATGYDLSTIKLPDGKDPPAALTDFVKATAAELDMPVEKAQRLADKLVKFDHEAQSATAADQAANVVKAQEALKANWGPNYDANMLVAKNTALKLGVTPEVVANMEKAMGYDGIMEFFRSVGQKTGEDRFISSGNPNNPGIMTKDQAVTRKNDLMKDTAWVKRYLDGGTAEGREMTGLNTIIVGDDTAASRYA